VLFVGAVCRPGFRGFIAAAVVFAALYIFLNLLVIAGGLWYLAAHPAVLVAWYENVLAGRWCVGHESGADQGFVATASLWLSSFSVLAVGLSGLEIGLITMPLVRGQADDNPRKPEGRIRDSQKMLTAAALVTSCMLLASSVVTSMVIDRHALEPGGAAAHGAMSFIAHGGTAARIGPLFGPVFGTIYDIITVAILWVAGAGSMSALLNWWSRYLPRQGRLSGPTGFAALAALVTGIGLLMTWVFGGSVELQAGVCAAAVLVLMCNNCLAAAIIDWNRRPGRWYERVSWRYFGLMIVFACLAIAMVAHQPACLVVAAAFIVTAIMYRMIFRRRSAPALQSD
jgi:hypothetical protein